jgi:hypothetical protein
VEGAKTKYILVALVVIVIVTASVGYYLITSEASDDFITAMEEKERADDLASDWNDDAILTGVGSMGEKNNIGGASGWCYMYISPSNCFIEDNVTHYDTAYIEIFYNGTSVIENNYREDSYYAYPIDNWTIDSSQAHEIATNNSEINLYLQKYPNAGFGYMIKIWDAYPDCTVWYIMYQDWDIHDISIEAGICIDANTGEVLYVEADN